MNERLKVREMRKELKKRLWHLPNPLYRVIIKSNIIPNNFKIFYHRLGNDDSVERVTVMQWQGRNGEDMVGFDGKEFHVFDGNALKKCTQRLRRLQLSNVDFNGQSQSEAVLTMMSFCVSSMRDLALAVRCLSFSKKKMRACVSKR